MNFLEYFGIQSTKEEIKTYEKELKVIANNKLYYYKKEKYDNSTNSNSMDKAKRSNNS